MNAQFNALQNASNPHNEKDKKIYIYNNTEYTAM